MNNNDLPELVGQVVTLQIVIGNVRGADGKPQGVVMFGGIRSTPSPLGTAQDEEMTTHDVICMALEAIKFGHSQQAKVEQAEKSLIVKANGPLPAVMRG